MYSSIKGAYKRLSNNKLFADSMWALIGSAAGKGLSLIAGVAIARFLGSNLYGEYGAIKNTLLMIAIFSTMGLGYSATKFIAENRANNNLDRICAIHRTATTLTLLMSGAIALLLVIFAKEVAVWLEAPHLYRALRLSALAIIFNAINTTQTGELSGFGAYKELAQNNTWSGLFTFVSSVALTYYMGFDGAIAALLISLVFNALLNYRTTQRYLPNSNRGELLKRETTKEIIKFSIPIALQEGLYSVTHWGSVLILVKFAGYTEMGISSAASQWMAVVLFIPGALRNVALTHLSASNSDKSQNKTILHRLMAVNFVSTLLPFIVIFILSGWICSWYGESFQGLQRVLNIAVFSAIVSSLTNVLTQEFMAHGRNWFLFISRLFRDIATLITLYFGILYLGNGALIYALSVLTWQSIYLFMLLYCLSNHLPSTTNSI